MLLLIGPAVAVIGIVAVVFVMRHKAVEKRSMYSSRRSQIEHKVRAARQRTLAPLKHAEKASRSSVDEAASAPAQTVTYEPSAHAGPPAAPPARETQAPAHPAWDSGPAIAPVYEPPAYEPPAQEPPPYQAPAAEPWTPRPSAPEPAPPERAAPAPEPATTSAGGGASWSIVGESKGTAEPEPVATKKSKERGQAGPWQLASGEVAGDEPDEGPKKPSAVLAIAQYAVLVVGLVMVLIGVVVMVANSHGA
jgi:FtsZ-interacting cell division protein ZipA